MTNQYGTCPKCGKQAVHLAMATVTKFYGDKTDDNGDVSIYEGKGIYPTEEIQLFSHVCYECRHLVDVGIESPRDKISR